MSWHCKPSGGYSIGSAEHTDNINEFWSYANAYGFTLEAACAIMGNIQSESGFNAWRWQSDSVSLTSDSKGYGLVQYTPAKGYIYDYGPSLPGYAPNLSTTEITSGANVSDAIAQTLSILTNSTGKYFIRPSQYYTPDQYKISWQNFSRGNDLYNLTGAWLYCFEWPAVRNETVVQTRYYNAAQIYEILSGVEPPTPPPIPPGPGPSGNKYSYWLLKKLKERSFGAII